MISQHKLFISGIGLDWMDISEWGEEQRAAYVANKQMANTEMLTKEFEIQSFQIKIEMEKVEERYKKGPQQEGKRK